MFTNNTQFPNINNNNQNSFINNNPPIFLNFPTEVNNFTPVNNNTNFNNTFNNNFNNNNFNNTFTNDNMNMNLIPNNNKIFKKSPTFANLTIETSNSFAPLPPPIFPTQNNVNQLNNNMIRPATFNIKDTVIKFKRIFGDKKPIGQELTQGNTNNFNNLIIMHQKFNFNIIYYDENLKKTGENNNYCSYFKNQLEGTFYGINDFNLFKYICHKVQQNTRSYILISSGSSAKKLYDYCNLKNVNKIYMYLILCCNTQKYVSLYNTYPKLKGIYKSFDDLTKFLFSNNNNMIIKNLPIKSSNLIYLSDYNSTYVKLHFEIVRKYSLYKLLKSYNFNESKFLEIVKNKPDYYVNLANELVNNDDEAMVTLFKTNIDRTEFELRQIFNHNHTVNNYISNYTVESFYYKYINKFLRKGDFDSFRLLSNHIAKFIYHLYEYRKTTFQTSNNILYRTMYITQAEWNKYLNSKGKVICFPSFTSTSLNDDWAPFKDKVNTILVKLIIQQNNSKSIIDISNLSEHPTEREYLCLPFTFFKITNVVCQTVNNVHSDIIYLTALNSDKPIEEMFLEFMENETDNIDPEGLQILRLTDDGLSLYLNNYIKAQYYKIYPFNF